MILSASLPSFRMRACVVQDFLGVRFVGRYPSGHSSAARHGMRFVHADRASCSKTLTTAISNFRRVLNTRWARRDVRGLSTAMMERHAHGGEATNERNHHPGRARLE